MNETIQIAGAVKAPEKPVQKYLGKLREDFLYDDLEVLARMYDRDFAIEYRGKNVELFLVERSDEVCDVGDVA